MNIGIISDEFYPPWDEGRKNMTRMLVNFLTEKGDYIHIISSDDIEKRRFIPKTFIKMNSIKSLETFLIFRKIVKEKNIKLLFSINTGRPFFAIKPIVMEKLLGIPYYLYVPSVSKNGIGNRHLINPQRIFAGGKYINILIPGSHLIYPLVDLSLFSTKKISSQHNGPPNILFLGAFQKERGLQFLIKAMAEVAKTYDIFFTIAWNGRGDYEKEILTLLDANPGLKEVTTLKGVSDISELYNKAYLVVIPRIISSATPQKMFFPLRIIEALLFQKPLIVSDIYDWREIIDGCGLTVSPGNIEQLRDAIIMMITNKEFYKSCVEACLQKLSEYHPAKSLNKIYQVFHQSYKE